MSYDYEKEFLLEQFQKCQEEKLFNYFPIKQMASFLLKEKIIKVEFMKKDKTIRTMICTLKKDELNKYLEEKDYKSTSTPRDINNNSYMAVFDLEKHQFRKINLDTLISISIQD